MTMHRDRRADRAVSTTVNYVLALAVLTMLIGGLFTATAGFVGDQQERAARTELSVLGNRLGADLAAADRLAADGGDGTTVALRVPLPRTVAGSDYRVAVEPDDPTTLRLTTTEPAVAVTVTVRTRTPVASGTVSGGPLVVRYDDGDGRLEVTRDAG
jgi:hypothetical protein